MRRVLRSSTMQKREKELLDLNKEPDYDSSAENVSAEENMVGGRGVSHPSGCEMESDSDVHTCLPADSVPHDIGHGCKGGKGENVSCSERGDAAVAKDSEARCESPLVLIDSCSTKEGTGMSQPLEYAGYLVNEDVASNVGASIDSGAAGKRRRGRKRKTVEITSPEGPVKELVHLSSLQDGVEEKNIEIAKSLDLEKKEDEISVDASMGGDLCDSVMAKAAGNTNKDRPEFRNGRRGRKRKVVDDNTNNHETGVIDNKVEKLGLDGKPQAVGRVLRSRTMATTYCEKRGGEKENVGCVGLQVNKEIDASEKKNLKMDTDGRVRASQNDGKVMKRRRGRPPKKVMVEFETNIKLPTVQDSKHSGLSDHDENTKKHKKTRNQLGAKAKKSADYHCQDRHPSEQPDMIKNSIKRTIDKSKHKNEGDLGRREEKQLVRDEIISLIKKVGWTIEYRPRNHRDYNDAVYVDWEGKTYWSVTLAYKSLKQMVENGTADVKAISVFTPISEDKLSILWRVRKEKKEKRQKGQEIGNKIRKKVKNMKLKRSALDCPGVSKCNENLNSRRCPGDVSSRKKAKRDSCEQGSSVAVSRRGRPRLNREAEIRKPFTLMARGSRNGLAPEGGGLELYEGKRNILSWMIDLGTVPLGVKVKYMSPRTNVILEGKLGREGICCGCCNRILTLSDFESHAGSKLGQPFNNIYLESGPSLLQSLTDTWRKLEKSDDIGFHLVDVNSGDPNDDTCNICGDGGDLICCDGCPSTFHQSCLQIQKCPSGDWHCVYCSCKFCGMAGQKAYQRDDLHDADDFELLTCLSCEEKFHGSCIQGNGAPHVNSKGLPFCGRGCQKLFEHLETLIGMRHELEEGFSWTIIRRQDMSKDSANSSDSSKVECNSKLAVAFSIMDECFLPIIDVRSKTSMVQSVIYSTGSNFKRLNYSGFFTCILERGDELVSAAAIRIHGNQLAEMPFIGTRYMYRRQGMCRRLLTAVETALTSLEVKKLVIPAIPELNETWTKVFGFSPLEESMRQEMKYTSMIVFPGTDMLHKSLYKNQCTERELTTAAGSELSQVPMVDVKGYKTGLDSDAPKIKLQGHDDESAAGVGPGTVGPDGSLKDGPETTKELHLPVGMTCATAQSGNVTGLSGKENSKSNFNLDQVRSCGAESNSLMSSTKGALCCYPVDNSVLESDDFSHMKCVKETSAHEDSVAISDLVSNSTTDQKGIAVHAILQSQQEKDHEPGLVMSVECKQDASSEALVPVTEVGTSDNPGDELLLLTSAVETSEALGSVNHEAVSNSFIEVSIPDDPNISPKKVNHGSSAGCLVNTPNNCEPIGSLCSNPDVTCLSTAGNSSSCIPEVDPGRELKSG